MHFIGYMKLPFKEIHIYLLYFFYSDLHIETE